MNIRDPLLALLLAVGVISVHAADAPRLRAKIDDDWKFRLGDPADAMQPGFNDADWCAVTLPHDWSIEGKIDPNAPMGGGGGFFPAGVGWYRLHFEAPAEWSERRVQVEFEGVYMNADVYLNGRQLATHPYGYTGFFVDLTPALRPGADNVLAVRVDNSRQKNSRWYSGSGIYRHVWMTVTNPVHVAPWGVFARPLKADAATATVAVETQIVNEGAKPQLVTVENALLAPNGSEVAKLVSEADSLPAGQVREIKSTVAIKNPALWSPEKPQMSAVRTRLLIDGKCVDETLTPFGIRELAWSAEKGLTLNGKSCKLNGGCIHHDNGVLGACAFDRAEERKIELLKAAGFNAIRTAHNPPSPALLDACDRLGMLVMDEDFDCWVRGKNPQDYSVVFKDWWQRDIDSMIKRDRNHPSVVMWSIGNEVPGVYAPMGAEYEPKIANRIRALDRSRPITNGIFGWPVNDKKPAPDDAQKLRSADALWDSLDVVGTNYLLSRHIGQHARYPNRILVSTESNPPIGQAFEVADNAFVVGDFVWSAMDYLGEVGIGRWFYEGDPTEPLDKSKDPADAKPRPVNHGNDRLYPWKGAVCGDLDILGHPRPAARFRSIMWNAGERLALAVRVPEDDKKIIVVGWGWSPTTESWTWPGREGKPMTVEVASRSDQVRLYLNDKLIGEQPTTRKQNFQALFMVNYAPGTLKAVGVEAEREVGKATLVTAGEPAAIRLAPDRATIHADGQDLSFVSVEVVDAAGRLQPNAMGLVTFQFSGPGTIAGLGSADLKSEEPYQGSQCHVFHGRALLVLRASQKPGALKLTATSSGLTPASVTVNSVR